MTIRMYDAKSIKIQWFSMNSDHEILVLNCMSMGDPDTNKQYLKHHQGNHPLIMYGCLKAQYKQKVNGEEHSVRPMNDHIMRQFEEFMNKPREGYKKKKPVQSTTII